MFKPIILYICFLTLCLTIYGCEKNKPQELPRLPGIETSIREIQITPLAYDRAIVTFSGIVTEIDDIGESGDTHKIVISDPYENTLNLKYTGDTGDISPGDTLVVSGIYDKSGDIVITERIAKIPIKPGK